VLLHPIYFAVLLLAALRMVPIGLPHRIFQVALAVPEATVQKILGETPPGLMTLPPKDSAALSLVALCKVPIGLPHRQCQGAPAVPEAMPGVIHWTVLKSPIELVSYHSRHVAHTK